MHLKTPCNSIIAESPPLLVFLTNKQEESPKWDTPRGRERSSINQLVNRYEYSSLDFNFIYNNCYRL
jgi:hypothetical protein